MEQKARSVARLIDNGLSLEGLVRYLSDWTLEEIIDAVYHANEHDMILSWRDDALAPMIMLNDINLALYKSRRESE